MVTLVGSTTTSVPPPRKLGRHGQALWDAVHAQYRIEDIGGQELLCQACTALDRAEALAERIRADGEMIQTRNGMKCHPAVKEELSARGFIVRTIQKLGLNYEIVKPVGRPGGGIGWSP